MAGIAHDTVEEFQARIDRFRPVYVDDWDMWLATPSANRPRTIKRLLGKWQACRGNPIRDVRGTIPAVHKSPHIDELLAMAEPNVSLLRDVDMRLIGSFTPLAWRAITALWPIFEQLSYASVNPNRKKRAPRGGLAGVVAISKATMLVTNGRVGPAFDSRVRKELGLKEIRGADEWLNALRQVVDDISIFETRNGTTLQAASGFQNLNTGRIYDMALGPG